MRHSEFNILNHSITDTPPIKKNLILQIPPGESACAHLVFGERIGRMIKNPYNEIIENSAWGEIFQKCKYMKIHNF